MFEGHTAFVNLDNWVFSHASEFSDFEDIAISEQYEKEENTAYLSMYKDQIVDP